MNKLIITALILVIIAPVYGYASQVGGKAPLFLLPDLNGRTISLEQFHGKVVFLAFWAPWCIPCNEELPELEKLHQKYGKDAIDVIA